MHPDNTLGEVVRKFLPALLKEKGISKYQLKVLRALALCRTPALRGSVMACNDCGSMHYVLHSCRMLPVKYFHVVFTVPHHLLELFCFNRESMYNLLFEKSWETLFLFAKDPKLLGAAPGAIAVLHTCLPDYWRGTSS